ncbi:MAG: MCE family protein [Pseudonocardia sp.]|nr:MCE family protein [Pseudonocardia sp.]
MRLFAVLGGVIALVIAGAWLFTGRNYTVNVALPSATNIIKGGVVTVNGFKAGSVSDIKVVNSQAVLTLEVDREYTPLHEGAAITVPFKALLGERYVDIKDGPVKNTIIPDGGTIPGVMPQPVEVDQVLNGLDPVTLAYVRALINDLDSTVRGHEGDINASVTAAGPALNALGNVLDAVGTDGPAIRALVTRLNAMVGTLSDRQQDIRTIVTEFSRLTSLAAKHQAQLRQGLRQLPPTLRTARETFGKVPGVAEETVPLLEDLEHPTHRLISVAHNLRPLFDDLRPTLHDLGPTLSALDQLLDYTPGLLRSAHDTLPGLTYFFDYLRQPLNFLRPYTPEAMGWLSNWNSGFASYDSNGHYARIDAQYGPSTYPQNPGVVPPGTAENPYPMPGQNGGTPWTDAWGSGVR